MLLHVMPKSECLLFVKTSNDQEKKFEYGSPGGKTTSNVRLITKLLSFRMHGGWNLTIVSGPRSSWSDVSPVAAATKVTCTSGQSRNVF